MLPPCKMSNFCNSLKAPTLANQNLAKVASHIGHFKKIRREPGQKPPETETKADKSRCILTLILYNYLVFWSSISFFELHEFLTVISPLEFELVLLCFVLYCEFFE